MRLDPIAQYFVLPIPALLLKAGCSDNARTVVLPKICFRANRTSDRALSVHRRALAKELTRVNSSGLKGEIVYTFLQGQADKASHRAGTFSSGPTTICLFVNVITTKRPCRDARIS